MSPKTKFAIAALLLIIAVVIACTHGRKFYFAKTKITVPSKNLIQN